MALAEVIGSELRNIGINAKIVTYDWATYLAKTEVGEHDMAMLGWIADVADPDTFFYSLLSIPAAEKPAYNIAFYRSTEMQNILERSRMSTDEDVSEFAISPEVRGIDEVGVKPLTDRDIRIRLWLM